MRNGWMFSVLVMATSLAALAEEAPKGGPGGPAIAPLIPLILIMAIFYFMVIRPQQKKAKLHQQFVTDLKKGDMVITNSGIIGTIRQLSEKFVTLEVDEDVCLKVVRSQILESANTLKEEPKPAKAT